MNNLLSQLHQFAGPSFVESASKAFNETEDRVHLAMKAVYPLVLWGLSEGNTSNQNSMVGILHTAANDYSMPGDIQHLLLTGIPDHPAQGVGSHLISILFGTKVAALSNLICNYSGIKPTTASSLFQLGGSVASAFLGKKMLQDGLNINGLSNWLHQHRSSFLTELPDTVSSYMNIPKENRTAGHSSDIKPVNPQGGLASDADNGQGGGAQWILPIILLGLLGAFLWYWLAGSKAEDQVLPKLDNQASAVLRDTDHSQTAAVAAGHEADLVHGRVNADGDWIVQKGAIKTLKLANGKEIPSSEGGFEDMLFNFINDPSSKVNEEKGDWFNFDDLLFETGKSRLKPGGEVQLQHMVEILEAYPSLTIKVGGYTDNQGDSVQNNQLSEARAKTVYNELLRLGKGAGITKDRFDAKHPYEGYGSLWPVADNTTPEGRAQNRRIAIRVITK